VTLAGIPVRDQDARARGSPVARAPAFVNYIVACAAVDSRV